MEKMSIIIKAFVFAFVAIALMCLSSCGRGGREYTEETTQTNGPTETGTPEPSPPDTAPATITLTISTPEVFTPVLREAERLANLGHFGQLGQTLQLEITDYDVLGWEDSMVRFNTMFMSGSGYDLFVVDNHPLWNYSRSGMLTDIYTLIDRCHVLNRDNFYTNVLEAFEYRGQLLSIPLNFGFTYTGVNSTLPQPFIDRYMEYETISHTELFAFYHDLKAAYPGGFDHMNISYDTIITWAVGFNINEFIDADARSINLANIQFTNFLEDYRSAISHSWSNHISVRSGGFVLSKPMLDERVRGYVFNTAGIALRPWEALFELEDPPFLHYIPLTDGLGRLAIDNFSSMLPIGNRAVAVSAGANQDTAWVLIRYLIDVVADTDISGTFPLVGQIGLNSLKTSIVKEGFEDRARRGLNHVFDYAERMQYQLVPYVGQGTEGGRERQIENAVARLQQYNAMPVVQRPYLPQQPDGAFLWNFIYGAIEAQDLARQWQNQLSLWLIE
ncbi:MAG: hypothetical protein FWD90_01485 [Defluviitaleaceae bacterium]|nr:hypothetical protein [Defluviitaleaceae bacterium]